jgi:hypothetical protein
MSAPLDLDHLAFSLLTSALQINETIEELLVSSPDPARRELADPVKAAWRAYRLAWLGLDRLMAEDPAVDGAELYDVELETRRNARRGAPDAPETPPTDGVESSGDDPETHD